MEYKEIIEAIKNNKLGEFIINNYYKMEKGDLRDLIIEIYYLLLENIEQNEENIKQYNNNLVNNLIEYRSWEK